LLVATSGLVFFDTEVKAQALADAVASEDHL
jgi:hypothetical protein